jgi:hypothetical protein
MEQIVTWADGYGVWHASVPIDSDSEKRARDAILDELRIRSHPKNMVFAYKYMTVTQERINNHGTVVYRETWPDEFPELAE